MSATSPNIYFSSELLNWYQRHKRDLPWRRSKDPYRIWVSEVMLQQTRVDTVIPYYHRFMEKYPTVSDLADAKESEVLKAWEGLGYYSRARNLQAAVREVKERYGGKVPASKAEMSSLKGVGPYTSGAVLSIAYNLPEPAVDGNVMRVLSRYFLIEDDIAKPATRNKMEKLAVSLIPEGAASDFNQAIMELGALVCTPRSPQCLTCPVMHHCAGRKAGMEEQLPIKKKAKAPRLERRVVALIEGSKGQAPAVLIRQRPSQGLLAGMWELPHELLAAEEAEEEQLMLKKLTVHLEGEGLELLPLEREGHAQHIFSHIQWEMDVFRCRLGQPFSGSTDWLPAHYRWVTRSDMEQLAFPNVFLKMLNRYFG